MVNLRDIAGNAGDKVEESDDVNVCDVSAATGAAPPSPGVLLPTVRGARPQQEGKDWSAPA